MKKKKTKLSQSFQRWLIVLVAIAFLATTAFLWLIQTRLSENNAIDLLALNLSDVREDIIDASDANLIKLAWSVAADLNPMEDITGDTLQELTAKYDVTEINVIDPRGVIVATTHPAFLDYYMGSGTQSAKFMGLLSGETELGASWDSATDLPVSVLEMGYVFESALWTSAGFPLYPPRGLYVGDSMDGVIEAYAGGERIPLLMTDESTPADEAIIYTIPVGGAENEYAELTYTGYAGGIKTVLLMHIVDGE